MWWMQTQRSELPALFSFETGSSILSSYGYHIFLLVSNAHHVYLSSTKKNGYPQAHMCMI